MSPVPFPELDLQAASRECLHQQASVAIFFKVSKAAAIVRIMRHVGSDAQPAKQHNRHF